jgi:glyoxylase-like metal-dependent hydrolase (beta-lactamase superfamily II)
LRVILLQNSGLVYTSNVHLVLGDWSAIGDVNTLVDVGRDTAVLEALAHAPTGVGKRAVEQVVLTHGHYDHVELLGAIRDRFQPTVCALHGFVEGVDRELRDGDELQAGDRSFEVLHTPGHSSDSICLFCPEEGVLFAGDTTLLIHSADGTYEESFAAALEKICARNVRAIYFGHGAPLLGDCKIRLRRSLEIVKKSVKRGRGSLDTNKLGDVQCVRKHLACC